MKILHLIDSSGVGGGERYLADLIRHSDSTFRHHIVLPSDGPLEDVLQNQHIEYDIVSMDYRQLINSIRKLRYLINILHIDIVHTHGYRANFYGRVASLLARVKHIATIHVSLYDYLETPRYIRSIYLWVEKILSFRTSKYICISEAMKGDLLKMGIGKEKIEVIHNGVDLKVFYPHPVRDTLLKELGVYNCRPIIGTVGRMVPEKGQIYLIQAIADLKDKWPTLRCLFIGTGVLLEQLKQNAKELHVDDMCIFSGVRWDIADIYPLFDLFILPSLREPFGLVLLEAMASCVPVVATDSGGPPDFIEDGFNGILVPASDSHELAVQIDNLLLHREKSTEIAQRGYETVRTNYSIQTMVEHVERVYGSVMQ